MRAAFAGALVMLAAIAVGSAATAQTPVETAIRSWIATIDASPDWSATYRDLAFDPASGSAKLSGLRVSSASPGFDIGFDSMAVVGFRETGDGSFAARRVTATGGTVAAGTMRIAVSDIVLDDFASPRGGGFVWDPARPFTSTVKAYGPLTKVRMGRARIGSLSLVRAVEGDAGRISYDGITIEDWADGKIGSASAGPLRMEAPSQNPLVTMKVAHVAARDIDLAAFLHVYDPDTFVGGVGDRVWRTALGAADYRDAVIEIPGAGVKIGAVSIANVKVRQPPRRLAALFDRAMLGDRAEDDWEPGRRALDLASAFAIGRFSMSPIDVNAIGFDRIHLDGFSVADLSTEGLGELAIDGFEGAVRGEATVAIGRLAFGGMAFPKTEAILAAIQAAHNGGDVDVSALTPTIGFIEAGGFDVDVTGFPRTRLGKLRIDLDRYVGAVPTAVNVEIADADLATSMITYDRVRGLLTGFGYERVHVDSSLKVSWNEDAGTTAVDGFRLAMEGVGTLSGDAAFTGPSRAEIERMNSVGTIVEAVSLKSGTFTFEDDSIVGRVLAGQAARMKVDPDRFREQFARGLPLMLSFLGNRDFQTSVAPVLQTFIKTPGSITFMAAPAAPIAVSAIMAALRASPFSLPSLLALTVTGEAGPEPAGTPTAEPKSPDADPPEAARPEGAGDDEANAGEMRRTMEPAE